MSLLCSLISFFSSIQKELLHFSIPNGLQKLSLSISRTHAFLKLIIFLVIQVSSIDLEPTKYYLLAAARQVLFSRFWA